MGDFGEMDGMAPDAKISFFDIGKTLRYFSPTSRLLFDGSVSTDRIEDVLAQENTLTLIPSHLSGLTGRDYLKIPELEKIFDSAYKTGARVHTNSWGNVGGIYGQLSMDVDRYLHQHQDFFVLFAGGNEGYSGLRSVIAPGNAKNCLTVGATQLRTVAQDEELDDPVRSQSYQMCRLDHCYACSLVALLNLHSSKPSY